MMQLNSEIITHFRNFIQTNSSISYAQQLLKEYRNIQINPFTMKDSRSIWMSLMLYKFKKELDVSDELWTHSRQVILSVLRSDNNLKIILEKYLKTFEIWKSEDLTDLVTQVGGNYYNILQIKKSIDYTGNEETIAHWMPHYQNLIQKIRSYCKNVGILEKLDKFVSIFEQQKYDIVKEIMDIAYWNKIEEDIDARNLDIIYSNLSELKTVILDIIPKTINTDYIDEYFDLEYIKHLVENNVLDKDYLIKLFIFVINILKEWDAEVFKEKYDNEINEIQKIEGTLSHIIRCVIQKLMICAIDLKNRKVLWNVILKK